MSVTEQHFDLDARVSRLELEWQRAFETHVRARAAYYTLSASPDADLEAVDRARELYEQSEAGKSQVLDKIDRLESRLTWRT